MKSKLRMLLISQDIMGDWEWQKSKICQILSSLKDIPALKGADSLPLITSEALAISFMAPTM